jgi:hypothetical protein
MLRTASCPWAAVHTPDDADDENWSVDREGNALHNQEHIDNTLGFAT